MGLTSDRELSVHEAGHAVVAVRQGWQLDVVTIEPGHAHGPSAGHCAIRSPVEYEVRAYRTARGGYRPTTDEERDAEAERKVAREAAIHRCGGLAAEQLEMGSAGPSDIVSSPRLHGATTDLRDVFAWAGSPDGLLNPTSMPKAISVYMRATRILAVPASWRAVEALAAALVDRRTIPGPEAEEIIRKARRSRA